jgi:hypothetical protein
MSAMSRYTVLLIGTLLLANPGWGWARTKGACSVAQFKAISLRHHQPQTRSAEIEKWLVSHAGSCSDAQLSTINENSSLWLGTALTPAISALIEGAIEAKIAGQPAAMGRLYESLGKEAAPASTETISPPQPRAPVVRPNISNGVLSGNANYGTISQGNVVNQNEIALQNSNLNNSAGAATQQSANAGRMPTTPVVAAPLPARSATPMTAPGNTNTNTSTNQTANLNNAPGGQVVQGAGTVVQPSPTPTGPR